jgi:hypothetical protein
VTSREERLDIWNKIGQKLLLTTFLINLGNVGSDFGAPLAGSAEERKKITLSPLGEREGRRCF